MKLNNEKGFSLIELMMVVAIIGILANLAFPHYYQLIKKADAAKVIGDLHSIHIAANTYYAENNNYPSDSYPGGKPDELEPYLFDQFSFDLRPELDVRYDWENWSGLNGNPSWSHTDTIYGISVTTDDMALVNTIMGMLGEDNFHYTLGHNYTYIIQPDDLPG